MDVLLCPTFHSHDNSATVRKRRNKKQGSPYVFDPQLQGAPTGSAPARQGVNILRVELVEPPYDVFVAQRLQHSVHDQAYSESSNVSRCWVMTMPCR